MYRFRDMPEAGNALVRQYAWAWAYRGRMIRFATNLRGRAWYRSGRWADEMIQRILLGGS